MSAKEAPEQAEAPKNGKKGLIIIIAAVVLALVIGVGAAMVLMKKSHPPEDEGEEGQTEHVEKKKSKKPAAPPVIAKLDQFTVKLQPEGDKADQYLQVTIELEMLDAPAAEQVKVFLSKIRANILLILLGKTGSALSTPEGVKALAAEVTREVNRILNGGEAGGEAKKPEPAADDPVQGANITQIIIQ